MSNFYLDIDTNVLKAKYGLIEKPIPVEVAGPERIHKILYEFEDRYNCYVTLEIVTKQISSTSFKKIGTNVKLTSKDIHDGYFDEVVIPVLTQSEIDELFKKYKLLLGINDEDIINLEVTQQLLKDMKFTFINNLHYGEFYSLHIGKVGYTDKFIKLKFKERYYEVINDSETLPIGTEVIKIYTIFDLVRVISQSSIELGKLLRSYEFSKLLPF